MEEKILVKSERYNTKIAFLISFFIVVILCVQQYLSAFIDAVAVAKSICKCSGRYNSECRIHRAYFSFTDYAWNLTNGELWITVGVIMGIGIIFLLIYAWLCSYEMTVTDKRIYGRAAFGKRVDLPVDSVSAVGSRWPKGIAVATSSGKIAFLMIKNRDEIHKCVSDLLIGRQGKLTTTATPVFKQETPLSNAEELKKYKELLDMDVITQEEFDAKKKQLLGL